MLGVVKPETSPSFLKGDAFFKNFFAAFLRDVISFRLIAALTAAVMFASLAHAEDREIAKRR